MATNLITEAQKQQALQAFIDVMFTFGVNDITFNIATNIVTGYASSGRQQEQSTTVKGLYLEEGSQVRELNRFVKPEAVYNPDEKAFIVHFDNLATAGLVDGTAPYTRQFEEGTTRISYNGKSYEVINIDQVEFIGTPVIYIFYAQQHGTT